MSTNGYRITEVEEMPETRRKGRYDDLINDIILRLEKTKPPKALRVELENGRSADGLKNGLLKWLKTQQASTEYVTLAIRTEGETKVLYIARGPKWFLPG